MYEKTKIMDEYTEGLFVVAIYLFVVVAFSLPPIIIYLYVRIMRTIKKANKILEYVEQSEEESRKYHE